MQLRRNEIRTGLLVIVTGVILIGVVLRLGAPGIMNSLKPFHILFDNVSGMKAGAPVFLAGRKIGHVTGVLTPVPLSKRPEHFKHYEALVDIAVDADAAIYKDVNVQLRQYGLLAEQVIDFTIGDEKSGMADADTVFIGSRMMSMAETAPHIVGLIKPVSDETLLVLKEVRTSLKTFNGLTSKDGLLWQTAENARDFSDTIKKQPWRLIWKSTKEYPEENQNKAIPTPK